ncbi:MAG: hypothetical protein AAFR96_00210 [Planctomycetota bacterium]
MSEHKSGSLLEGIDFEKRKPVDADWSKLKRATVGGIAAVAAAAAVAAGGWFAWQNRPISLPTTAEQAVATISSGRIDRLPPERQVQYFGEAYRLLQDTPREDWRELFNEDDRQALGRIMRAQFEESIRQVARGEMSPQEMFENMMRGRQRSGDGERRSGPPREGESGQGASDRRQRFASRLQDRFQNGNAQQTGLTGEFFTMMRAQRAANGETGGPTGGRPGNRPGS